MDIKFDGNNNNIQSRDKPPVELFTKQHAYVGNVIAWSAALIITIYLVTLVLGFISLKSPDEPIGNPYFSILELLIIILGPLMVFLLVFVHKSTPEKSKIYSLSALFFMSIMTCITCSLHFVILTLSQQEAFMNQDWSLLVFSFNWPSVVYALDILAWDFFFALSMLFLSATFRKKGLEKLIQILLIISGVLSFVGLLGIPMNNMQIRNIGIIGYTIFPIIVFFLIGIVFNRRIS
ncbi:MAG: hypothetical protein K9J13_02430 [Saprospiraceae bacterium]|nr:hypothetical protein [Saprospiraceae bacterium]